MKIINIGNDEMTICTNFISNISIFSKHSLISPYIPACHNYNIYIYKAINSSDNVNPKNNLADSLKANIASPTDKPEAAKHIGASAVP